MASPTRTLTVNFVGRTESLERAFKRVNKGSSLMSDKLARTMRMGVGAIGGLGAAFGGLVALTKPMVDSASDIGESLSKNEVLFGRSADKVASWSESTSRSFGISRREALESVGQFGALTHAMGMTGEEGSEMSVRMVELAADMASFNNASPAETLIAIQAGLRGEQEPLRRFGVLLDQATLKQRALSEGIITTTKGALTPQQKALAAYSEILAQTEVQQGDFERTSDGLANKQRILSAVWDDLQVKLGEKLLPAFQSVTTWLADEFVPKVEEMVGMSGEELGEEFGKGFTAGVKGLLGKDRFEGKSWYEALGFDFWFAAVSTSIKAGVGADPFGLGWLLNPFADEPDETPPLSPEASFDIPDLRMGPRLTQPSFTTTPGMGALPPHAGGGRGALPPTGLVFDPNAAPGPPGSQIPDGGGSAVPDLPVMGQIMGTPTVPVPDLSVPGPDLAVLRWLETEGAQNLLAQHANAPVMNNQITINTAASADEVVDRLGEYVRANGPLARGWIDQG